VEDGFIPDALFVVPILGIDKSALINSEGITPSGNGLIVTATPLSLANPNATSTVLKQT
jgi:hypothetical protein